MRGADPNTADNKGNWPLLIAAAKADCTLVRMLLAKGADPSKVDRLDTTRYTMLDHRKSPLLSSNLLSSSHLSPSHLYTLTHSHGRTALHIASLYGHSQIAECLLKHDSDVYQATGKGEDERQGMMAPHVAAKADHVTLLHVFARWVD